MLIIELPRQYASKIIEVGSTVFVAALLWQMLENPVAISGSAI